MCVCVCVCVYYKVHSNCRGVRKNVDPLMVHRLLFCLMTVICIVTVYDNIISGVVVVVVVVVVAIVLFI